MKVEFTNYVNMMTTFLFSLRQRENRKITTNNWIHRQSSSTNIHQLAYTWPFIFIHMDEKHFLVFKKDVMLQI